VWATPEELAELPTRGPAWEGLAKTAGKPIGEPDLADQDSDGDSIAMAKGLVFARTGGEELRREVSDACAKIIGTEKKGDALALGRNLIGYVIAADLVGLPSMDPDGLRRVFRRWLRKVVVERLTDERTLVSTHEERPNNWGTHAGASRVAVAAYLKDPQAVRRCAQVFKGWLGDRQAHAGFEFGDDLSWQADPKKPVGVNPKGATLKGHSIDGALPDDQRRAGPFTWPPPKENYVWEALQGALAQAEILFRCGYDAWEWEDRALFRAATWLHAQCEYPATGDDEWQPHLLNFRYRAKFPTKSPARHGKSVGFTDLTHARNW